MPKVGTSVSFTFRIGPDNRNQFAKVLVEVLDIDTSLPIQDQLDKSKETLDEVWKEIKKHLDEKLDEILDENE